MRAKRRAVRAIFRIYPDGDLVAILPEVDANPGMVTCYSHVGQHCEGDYQGIVAGTRLATAEERDFLQRELRGIYGEVLAAKRLVRGRGSER